MTELKALLEAFSRGQTTFEALSRSFERYLAESPEQAPEVLETLRRARDGGLPHHVFVALSSRVSGAATRARADHDPTVRLPGDDADDRTVQLPGDGRGAAAADADRTQRLADPEATVLASDEDVTAARSAAPPDDDADATVLAADEDVTAARSAPPAGGEADATVLAPEEDGERTARAGHDDATGHAGDADATEVNAAGSGAEDATAVNAARSAGESTAVNRRPGTGREERTGMRTARPGGGGGDPAVRRPGGRDEETELRTVLPGRSGAAGDEGTELRTATPRTEGATEVNAAAPAEDDFDILDPSAMEAASKAAESSQTGASWPTSAGRDEVEESRARIHEFGAGDRLRGRFELISKLGEGGMGAVWKAKDLLKEEAKDRNPFVAVKLLTGDFKQHPEAFIALQRETSKQQRLAHPNIATVYDFDRDGDTVYMTMEVMEGQPLDSYIRKLPAEGLPAEEAMRLIEQLAAGLSYAHQAKLVHSDLKPGNCFLTRDGTVKLLDFGIARASKTKADAEGETTVFDPGQLGALTPTYATVEMFEGKEPDPRDDIYALAIIAYQLFTGRHPYGKQSAPKAMEQNLVPAPVTKLNKRQNKGLRHGLAFLRDARTPTVDQFLEEVRPRKSRAPLIAGGAVVLLLIIAALAYKPIQDYLQSQRNEEVIAQIASGDPQAIQSALQTIQGFDPEVQRAIKEDDRAKSAIFNLYTSRAEQDFNVSQERYDFPAAEKELAKLKVLYPDSAQVLRTEDTFVTQKDNELNRLNDQYNQLLEQGRVVPVEGEQDIGDVLDVVAKIDPQHPLLQDRQLPIKYADLAREAIQADDYQRADRILEASVAYAPDNPALSNLRYEVKTELKRQQEQALVQQIEQRLTAQAQTFRSLADFQRVRDDLIKLSDLRPASPVLVSLQDSLKKAFSEELGRVVQGGDWAQGEQLINDYAKLLEVPFLIQQRTLLSRAEQQAGYRIQMTEARQAAVKEAEQKLSTLLEKPEFTSDWEIALKLNYKELIALLPAGDQNLQPVRERIARVYLDKARESRAANRFSEALAFVEKGQNLYPGLQDFQTERDAIAAAEEALRRQQEEERRLARLEALKRTLIAKATANQPQEAKKILEELRAGLPADDPFLASEGPQAIGEAYLRLAQGMAEQEKFEEAEKLARGGLEVAPGLAALQEALQSYDAELEKRALVTELRKRLDSTQPLDTAKVAADLKAVDSQFPDHQPPYSQQFAELRAKQILSMDVSAPGKLDAVGQRLAEYKALFPGREASLRKEVGGELARAVKSLEARDLVAANELYASARKSLPGIDVPKPPEPPKPSALAAQGLDEVKAGNLSAARRMLAQVEQETPNAVNLPALRQALETRVAQAQSDYQNFLKYKQANRAREGKPFLDRALALWSDNADFRKELDAIPSATGSTATAARGKCLPALAGYGQRARGTCHDTIAGGAEGPQLVVVPAGGGFSKPFAIGKYEISVGEWNTYCKMSGRCKPQTGQDSELPVTGVSLADAEAYAKWLSEQTGAVYRVPTDGEWEYAARAGGKQPAKDFNCRVTLGNQIMKGQALIGVKSGKPNGWGLTNYVGNAQELVKSGGGAVARGGAFGDPLSKCDITLSKPVSGADAQTGFRLVREMG